MTPWQILSSNLSVGYRTEGWNLSELTSETIQGERVFAYEVFFATPFLSQPVVNVGLTGFDIDQRTSGRISVKAVEITSHGFKIEVSTWLNSRVYSADISWLAIGF